MTSLILMSSQAAFQRRVGPLLAMILSGKVDQVINAQVDPSVRNRIEQLASKNNEGELSPEELEEYAGYVRANKLMALLRREAGRFKNGRATRAVAGSAWSGGILRDSAPLVESGNDRPDFFAQIIHKFIVATQTRLTLPIEHPGEILAAHAERAGNPDRADERWQHIAILDVPQARPADSRKLR